MQWSQGRTVGVAAILLTGSVGLTKIIQPGAGSGLASMEPVSPVASAPEVLRTADIRLSGPVARNAAVNSAAPQTNTSESNRPQADVSQPALTIVVKGANERLGQGDQGVVHLRQGASGAQPFEASVALVDGRAEFAQAPEGRVMIEVASDDLIQSIGTQVEWEQGSAGGGTIELDLLAEERAMLERTAIATLRSLSAGQQQMRASVAIDTDGDGDGEFGYMAELAGSRPMRIYSANGPLVGGPSDHLNPAFLAKSFGELEAAPSFGAVLRRGYYFRIQLPGEALDGQPVPAVFEAPQGGAQDQLPDPTAAEQYWGCYAWPADSGPAGLGTFFINQNGVVIRAEDRASAVYSGLNAGPLFDAAFAAGNPGDVRAALSDGNKSSAGNDGFLWFPVGN